MKMYKPMKRMDNGGPRSIDWRKFSQNYGSMFDDPSTATPPGAGPAIALQPNANNAYTTFPNSPATTNTSAPNAVSAPSTNSTFTNLSALGSSIAPFASNIVNSFRKLPMPAKAIMDTPPVYNRVNLDADRGEANRAFNAADVAAERGLASNQATAVRSFNMGQKLNQLSKINQQERNENTQISNAQSDAIARTSASNNEKTEEYNDALVERRVAQQREQSANLSNAADKLVGIQNEKSKAKTEVAKARVLASLYSRSGVLDRQRAAWKASGIVDPLGNDYKDLEKKSMGGLVKLK